MLKWKVRIVYQLNSDWKDDSDSLTDNNITCGLIRRTDRFRRLLRHKQRLIILPRIYSNPGPHLTGTHAGQIMQNDHARQIMQGKSCNANHAGQIMQGKSCRTIKSCRTNHDLKTCFRTLINHEQWDLSKIWCQVVFFVVVFFMNYKDCGIYRLSIFR